LTPFDVESHTDDRGEFWVTIAYKGKVEFNEITLSFEHDQFKWVSVEEFLSLESSDKLRRFAKNLK